MADPSEKQVERLQVLEQTMQSIVMQKQNFQTQLAELENALDEVNKSDNNPFRMVGGIMVEANKDDVIKELDSKKEMADLRLKTIEKQESKTQEEVKSLQEEVMKGINKN